MTITIFRCQYSDNEELIYDCFINPKYKVIFFFLLPETLSGVRLYYLLPQVGTEWVCKTQNVTAVTVGVGSIIKNVYGRLFRFIVDMCNATL